MYTIIPHSTISFNGYTHIMAQDIGRINLALCKLQYAFLMQLYIMYSDAIFCAKDHF